MKKLAAGSLEEWRTWLARNHATESEVWLVSYRKESGKPRIPYEEAVEEALCYGWIDSIVKRLDEDRFAQRFTPRRPGSTWSESNRKRLRRLLRKKRIQPAGLAASRDAFKASTRPEAAKIRAQADALPRDLEAALRANGTAWKRYESLAPGYRRRFIGWVISAKRPDTRRRRIQAAVELIAAGAKALLK